MRSNTWPSRTERTSERYSAWLQHSDIAKPLGRLKIWRCSGIRSNYRPGVHEQGEDMYLYRTTVTPAQARVRLLERVHALNALHDHPRWYDAVTANCLTSIRTQSNPARRSRWDWRLLLNGRMDRLFYDWGDLVTGNLSFPESKARSLINPAARAAGDSPDFSVLIRVNQVTNGK